jgi:hypothetical protein
MLTEAMNRAMMRSHPKLIMRFEAIEKLIGPLYLTDKGVVFVELTDISLPSTYMIMVDSMSLGGVTDDTGMSMQNSLKKDALADIRTAPTVEEDLQLALENADDIFVNVKIGQVDKVQKRA